MIVMMEVVDMVVTLLDGALRTSPMPPPFRNP